MLILAIESSCDESAIAIYGSKTSKAPSLLVSLVASQIELHRNLGGVVPELASRNHTIALPPLVKKALEKAEVRTEDLTAIAATGGPGLASSLMVGHAFAKGLALATDRPFLSINHMEGHLLSPFLGEKEIPPHLALVVSGGHTMLVHVEAPGRYRLLGQTIDDAAGEAFDKAARMLELPYPGGPEIEKLAHLGDPTAFDLPRSLLKEPHFNFSFSGLKTAFLYTIEKLPNPRERLADLCASFQAAVSDVLIEKSLRAAKKHHLSLITLSGGVSCNQTLRKQFAARCQTNNLTFHSCSSQLSTDNAAMIAYAASHRDSNCDRDDLLLDISPNLPLPYLSNTP